MEPVVPWYTSAIVRQQIAAFILALLGLFKIKTDLDIDGTLAAVFAGVAALIPLWTIFTRIFKPAPNLSQTAIAKEVELVQAGKIPPSPTGPPVKQSGRVQFSLLVNLAASLAIFAGVAVVLALLNGCVSTQAAYRAAPLHGESLVDTAYVMAEHYDAVLIEANSLKDSGRVPAALVERMRAVDRVARPIFLGDASKSQLGLTQLREVYTATHDAKSEVQLQRAVNDGARALSDLINAVKAARGQ